MTTMPYLELFSLLGGAFSGFLFKYLSQKSADQQALFEMLLKQKQVEDDSRDRAAKRDSSAAGQWVRRFLVVSLVFGIIVAPFILTLLGQNTIVEVTTPKKTFLGLFDWGGVTQFFSLNGYLITQELRSAVLATVGYYMGNATAKRD